MPLAQKLAEVREEQEHLLDPLTARPSARVMLHIENGKDRMGEMQKDEEELEFQDWEVRCKQQNRL